METQITDSGRIAGTRSTVYDVYHYLEGGDWHYTEIAKLLQVTPEQVLAAIRHIEEHKEEVLAVHRQIEERNARGNSPEVLAKLEVSRAKRQAWLKAHQEAKRQEGNGAR